MPSQKYLCVLRSQTGDCKPSSPSDMQAKYAAFQAWSEKYKDNIVDMGGKLKSGGTVLTSEGPMDGPFVEAKEIIGGFMIIAADSLEEAMTVVMEGPGMVSERSSVELREIHQP